MEKFNREIIGEMKEKYYDKLTKKIEEKLEWLKKKNKMEFEQMLSEKLDISYMNSI